MAKRSESLFHAFKSATAFLILCVAAGLSLTTAYAQLSTASINGTVRDASGAVIPGATIVLQNISTNVEKTTTTNNVGSYVFLDITPGHYTLEAKAQGFVAVQLNPFLLVVDQTATLDIALKVGSVTQSVTVSGVAEAVQASTAEVGAHANEQQIRDLPLNGRNFWTLLELAPGITYFLNAQTQNYLSINGQPHRATLWMLDGINNNGAWGNGQPALPPILDSIEEFKVEAHNDTAEFGSAIGGYVNVATKSGTNGLHGTGWEFVRNNIFDARNPFLAKVGAYRFNQFGGVVGGPVLIPKLYNGKNKTFFFFAYQGLRQNSPGATFARVPTAQDEDGNFSDVSTQLYNPFSTIPDPNNPGEFLRTPFQNNQVPTNLLDPAMVAYAQAVYPAAIVTGNGVENAFDPTPGRTETNEYSIRGDENIGSKDALWFRFSDNNTNISASGGFIGLLTATHNQTRNISGSWVHTFGPSSVFQAQFGIVRYDNRIIELFTKSIPSSLLSTLDFPSAFTNYPGGVTLIPTMSISGFVTSGETEQLNAPYGYDNAYKASFTKTHGYHIFKMGGGFDETSGYDSHYDANNVGFAATQTDNPENPGPTGSSVASFLLNAPTSAYYRATHENERFGGVLNAYFQDQWKATPKLTVNLGLRYDRTFEPAYGQPGDNNEYVGTYNLNGQYVVQNMPPSCAASNAAPCIPGGTLPANVVLASGDKLLFDADKGFGPRVGLAYRLFPRTALRGSFGIFYENWAGLDQTTQGITGTWPSVSLQQAANLNNPTAAQLTPNVKAQSTIAAVLPAPTPFAQVTWFMDPHLGTPYSQQWNLGIEHQLNQSTVLTVNYVGNGSRHLPVSGGWFSATTPGPGSISARQPYPYITPTYYDRPWGNSEYSALQVQLSRRYSTGFGYTLAYTWSKTIDTGCSGWYGVGAETCSIENPYDFEASRSVAIQDIPNAFSASWEYEFPFGKGKKYNTGNRVANYIFGNWQFNGLTTLRSGNPYTITVDGDIANTGYLIYGSGYERPNLVGNPNISNPTPAKWFNQAAFQGPAPFTYGNLGRDTMWSDSFKDLDLSLFRVIPISEGKSIIIRWEVFNVTNTPIFNAPNADFSNANFGTVNSIVNSMRDMQFGAKIIF